MKKQLAFVIISLFILTAVSPLAFGFNIQQLNVIENESEPQTVSSSDGGLMNSSWPMYSYDARHTGRSPYGKSGTWYKVKWTHGVTDWCGSPVIDKNGTIYLGGEKNLYAINSNGTRKWKYVTGGDISRAPAIAEDGTIYAKSRDGYIYAINPNGTLKWKSTGGGWGSSPVIDENGTIYVGSDNGRIYAINPNGTIKWTYKTGDWISTCPAIVNDTLFCGSYDTYLYAIYKNNGTLKWKYNSPHEIFEISIGNDDTIYFGNEYDYFFAINPNGTKKWRKTLGNYIIPSPAIAKNGTIYVIADTPDDKHSIFSMNPDGTINWEYQHWTVNPYDESFVSAPAIDKYGIIYLGARDGWFLALNPDGTLRWSFKAMESIHASPAIGEDGTIYFSSFIPLFHGNLYALEPVEGNSPPEIPSIDGPRNLKYLLKYTYTAVTTDPDGDKISYFFDWGDRTNSDWTELVLSGTSKNLSHRWSRMNVHKHFVIRVKAKDEHGAWSDWGRLKISISLPRNKVIMNRLYFSFLEQFPLLNLLLERLKI